MKSLPTVAFLIIVLSILSTSWAYLSASETGAVQGTVYAINRYGEYTPLGLVTVTASNSKGNFATSTDGNGFYALNLPAGTYKVTAQVTMGTFGVSRTVIITATSSTVNYLDFEFTIGDYY